MNRPTYLADEVPKMAAELVTLRASLAAAQSRVAALEAALRQIANWGPFPAMAWPDGRPMSYGTAFGSNGERDFMRDIARAALASPPPHDGEGGR